MTSLASHLDSKWIPATFAELDGSTLMMGGDAAERARYASAVLGWTGTPFGPVVVYQADRIISILEEDFARDCGPAAACLEGEHDHGTEAIEFFEFNVIGGWVGGRTPIYLYEECDEHGRPSASCPCPLEALDRWGESRALLAIEQAGGRTAGSAPKSGATEADYIPAERFPLDRLDIRRAQASILSAGSRPSRFWGAVAIPSEPGGPHILLYVYGQSNWSVVRPLLAYWGDAPHDTATLAAHATRKALHPAPGYRAYGTPIFLDPAEPIGRTGIRRLLEAAQRGEGAVPLAELLGTSRSARKSA